MLTGLYITLRFGHFITLMLIGALSTVALYLLQGGIMGDGWADVWQPAVWQAVAGTRFGGVWMQNNSIL